MPYIHILSNLPGAGVDVRSTTRTFLESLAPALKNYEEVVMMQLSLGQALILGDSDEPTVFVEIRDTEVLVENVHHTVKATSETVAQVFGVLAKRMYVNMQEVPMTHWGRQGVTVRKIADEMAVNEKAKAT